MSKCERCGRPTKSDGCFCWKCNTLWQKYMKQHPLRDYTSKEESDKRVQDFIRFQGE